MVFIKEKKKKKKPFVSGEKPIVPPPIRKPLGERDRLELASARAERAGILPTSARFPILKQGELTTRRDINASEIAAAKVLLAKRQTEEATTLEEEQIPIEAEAIPLEPSQAQVPAVGLGGQPFTEEGLLSGQAVPFTAEDVFDVTTIAMGGLGIKLGAKAITKAGGIAIKAGPKGILGASGKTVAKKAAQKSISKAGTARMKLAGVAMTVAKSKIAQLFLAGVLFSPISKLINAFTVEKWFAEDNIIRSVDTGLSQVRESLNTPLANVGLGAWTPSQGLEALDDKRDEINRLEEVLQLAEIDSLQLKSNPEFVTAAKLRIAKLREILEGQEVAIARLQISGELPDEEQIAILMEEMGIGEIE